MKKLSIALTIISALTLSACGKAEVSSSTLEEAKNMARENALFNAKNFRRENPDVKDWTAVSNGDSSQMPNCPQGDGWATLKLFSPDASTFIFLKCSTFSAATGCLREDEFKSKPFAAQDSQCQPTNVVPFPIPKIAK